MLAHLKMATNLNAHHAGILWEGVAAAPSPPSITTMPPVSNTTLNNRKNPKPPTPESLKCFLYPSPLVSKLSKQCHFIQAQGLALCRITIPVPCSSGRRSDWKCSKQKLLLLSTSVRLLPLTTGSPHLPKPSTAQITNLP